LRRLLVLVAGLILAAALALGSLGLADEAGAAGRSNKASCYGADYGKNGKAQDIDTTKSPGFLAKSLKAAGFSGDLRLNNSAQEALDRLKDDRVFYFDGHGNWDVISFRKPKDGPKTYLVTSGTKNYSSSNSVDFGNVKCGDLETAVFNSCYAGVDTGKTGNLMKTFVDAGAWSAVGFDCTVGTGWGTDWAKKLAKYAIDDDLEIEAAARKAAVDIGSKDITLASKDKKYETVASHLVVLRKPGQNNIRLGDGPVAAVTPPGSGGAAGVATALVFDISGTMGNEFNGSQKLAQAQAAGHDITTIIKNTSQKEGLVGEIAVASFDSLSYRNQDISSNYDDVETAIDGLRVGSATNLSAGIESGLDQLESASSQATKVMLLLSDGQANTGVTDPDAIIAGPVQRARDANVRINVIGFGEPNDLNEDLLKRIASETGGQYALANSSAIANSISNLFIKYQMQATHTVLGEYSGTVAQGAETQAGQFAVSQSGNLATVLNWPGSELELRFTDPQGTQVASGYPGLSVSSGRPLQVFIDGAQPGTWTVSVYGKQVSMGQEPYYALVAFKETSATPKPSGGGSLGGGGAEMWLLFIGVALAGGVGWAVFSRRPASPLDTSPHDAALAQHPPSRLSLVDSRGHQYWIKEGSNSLGRAGSNDIVIADKSVSRRHATVFAEGTSLRIDDLGSSLGTYMNGVRITEGTAVPGDQVSFGEARLTVATRLRESEDSPFGGRQT